MRTKTLSCLVVLLFCAAAYSAESGVLLEAESFAQKGGWVVDQQFMDLLQPGEAGSSILLAHGMGKPVENAQTTVTLPKAGTYRVFARTRNWVSPWMPKDISREIVERDWSPGKFKVVFNGKESDLVLGIDGAQWQWLPAGCVTTSKDNEVVSVEIKDLTGFDGRLDALYFTQAETCDLPNDPEPLVAIRRELLNLPENPPNAREKEYDLVVVGGGIAGTCAAVSAANLGLDVALIQDRPVLGGNGSTEIRVHLNGAVKLPPYPNVGNLTYQMGPWGGGNAQPADLYKDQDRLNLCLAQPTLDLYLNTHVYDVEKSGSKIVAVFGKDIETGVERRFAAKCFADCTGDATVGYLAGADWRQGREARSEYDEPSAPVVADKLTMGASIQWYTVEKPEQTTFPEVPWAHQFSRESIRPMTRGDWDWETGLDRDQIWDFERIRDNGLRAAYGHWSYMKNHTTGDWANKVRNREFGWMAFLAGKRESRRLLGDVVLREQDITSNRLWPDGCVPCTWSIDLHYICPHNAKYFPGQEFRSYCVHGAKPSSYVIPYRTFYSRNIDNLFMAGRNISVTHIGLGTVRVMRTAGMMGEVVGMAAFLCDKHNTLPRGVYENHLEELIELMKAGVVESPGMGKTVKTPKWLADAGENVARKATPTASCEHPSGLYPAKNINDGGADVSQNTSRWVSSTKNLDYADHWVQLNWDLPVTFNAMRMVTGQMGNYGECPKDPVRRFMLQVQKNGQWVTIPDGEVKENVYCDFGIEFPEVTTDALRIKFQSPGYLARLWEVELYNLKK
ncbi:MAG: FAD-dependent oxidoreductase [Planctomycetia bacterium]|nr:FAD-dependent oxidoreductase [Planctomycetia bacterium]